jgi:phage recombination protein Bet
MTSQTKTRPAPKAEPESPTAQVPVLAHRSLINKFAGRFSIDPERLLPILKATAFKQKEGEVSNEQMAALLIVADQYGLNPFTKEIFAFPDKQNGIVPVVSVDGWARIINERPELDGIEFRYSDEVWNKDGMKGLKHEAHVWAECVLYRKDRSRPTVVREFLEEVYREPFEFRDGGKKEGPWQSHTNRMLRHKTLIQCARVAFGFAGIYDEDEAHRIIEAEAVAGDPQRVVERGASGLKKALTGGDTTAAAGGAPAQNKMPGTVEQRDMLVKQIGECSDAEILDLVKDGARGLEWTAPDQQLIDDAYNAKVKALKGGS